MRIRFISVDTFPTHHYANVIGLRIWPWLVVHERWRILPGHFKQKRPWWCIEFVTVRPSWARAVWNWKLWMSVSWH